MTVGLGHPEYLKVGMRHSEMNETPKSIESSLGHPEILDILN